MLAQSQVRMIGLHFVDRPDEIENGRQKLTQRHRHIEVAVERSALLVVVFDVILNVREDERHCKTGEKAHLAHQHQVAFQGARCQIDNVEKKDERSSENERV